MTQATPDLAKPAKPSDTFLPIAGSRRIKDRAATVIHPGRRDVIAGGALVVEGLLNALGETDRVLISESDILDGVALSIPVE